MTSPFREGTSFLRDLRHPRGLLAILPLCLNSLLQGIDAVRLNVTVSVPQCVLGGRDRLFRGRDVDDAVLRRTTRLMHGRRDVTTLTDDISNGRLQRIQLVSEGSVSSYHTHQGAVSYTRYWLILPITRFRVARVYAVFI